MICPDELRIVQIEVLALETLGEYQVAQKPLWCFTLSLKPITCWCMFTQGNPEMKGQTLSSSLSNPTQGFHVRLCTLRSELRFGDAKKTAL